MKITDNGAIFSIRHGRTLINQVLPGPSEDGVFRLLLRWRLPDGAFGWARVAGSGIAHAVSGSRSITWESEPLPRVLCRATLELHPDAAAWAWTVEIENKLAGVCSFDVLMAQDLGLADEGVVRNSEAFTSQYIDLLPADDPKLGWVVLARQNIEMSGASFPWLATACVEGAVSYCTDGAQFFGEDYRIAGVPLAARLPALPSHRLQYECAMAGLQSKPVVVAPGARAHTSFVARFVPNHPLASKPADVEVLREVLPLGWVSSQPLARRPTIPPPASTLFVSSIWLHGDAPSESDWNTWYPGPRRHLETDSNGLIQSFFSAEATHVVSRAKEASVARPHGHILRSGGWRWIDPDQFGMTCFASGVFASQAYLGNQSLARLLPPSRDSFGIGRAGGQRVFVRIAGAWRQLGVPSAFSMTTGDVRWHYRVGERVIEARAWCSAERSSSFLSLSITGVEPVEFLVTHMLCLDGNEFDHSGGVVLSDEQLSAVCTPASSTGVSQRVPQAAFAIASAEVRSGAAVHLDGPLYADEADRGDPCVCLLSGPTSRFGVIMCGSRLGSPAVLELLASARAEWLARSSPSAPPPTPLRLSHPQTAKDAASAGSQAAVPRVSEILPWYAHNAAIHFSAPHGLEQHSGAAWGVRDVCQGSIEWLLASGEWALARRALETVFTQQYAHDGSWPQWFMHPPYQTIRQVDSHGDVMFWPVKALCDYVESSNDLTFVSWATTFADESTFEPSGPPATILEHCDRVLDLCEKRYVARTALVNYGDGDWDDTLRPADPTMRTHMISSWTVALAYHAFRQLAGLYARIGETARLTRVEAMLASMRRDFAKWLMPDSVVAGFMVVEADGSFRPLLHPRDSVTGIRYRLLPMTRAVLAELFTAEEAKRHLELVDRELLYPDGVRLMSEPATYQGGCERLFKRADSAANVGREIGLQYVHAHLRYAEAMAKVGDADRLWTALQVVNPVGISECVPLARPRQSNVYFSSSDAEFSDRVKAAAHWKELRSGTVGVRGGWRLYSSGPGLYLHKVRSCLLGVRESYGDVVFDPVLPFSLSGLRARVSLAGREAVITYHVKHRTHSPISVTVNGVALGGAAREANPYRPGGLRFPQAEIAARLRIGGNSIVVEM